MTLKQARPYLAATGLGPDSPQIVRQGTIQLVVGGDSAAIAGAISHAAGISYYLARRQEAESRLAQVREQLETIDVRLKEAQEGLKSARIRAGRARRRRQMKRERQALEMALAQVRRRELDTQIAEEMRQQNELVGQKGAIASQPTSPSQRPRIYIICLIGRWRLNSLTPNHLLAAGTQVFLLNYNEHSEINLDAKFISDDEPKGYEGTLVIVVGPQDGHYHVLLAGMPVDQATYPIEQ